ncbi:TCR/Tet family MFS transporter [Asticcacaulis solisilvae]|uniref:TCR/Tet family MFS transporter n=1 Tax=Asticcacaulis solisilvae TaxID=1217274 RepID=UPI003FD7B944
MSSPAPRRQAAAAFVLVTVFLDMLSIGIMIPVLPQLIKSFVGGSVSAAGMWTGIFGLAWGFAQFIFSPIQGGLSDSIGRRPVILASNFGTGVDYLLMAVAPNLWWLLIGRVISGITAASISTAYAYMSDVTPPEGRAKVFGTMGAAFGIGFIVGPAVSAFLGHQNPHLPLFFAAALSLANFLYGLFVLPESLPADRRKPFSFHAANPVGAVKFLARSGQVLRLASMYLLMMFSQNVYPTTFVLYAGYRFNWGMREVSLCLSAVGVMAAVVQAGLTGIIVKRIGERRTMFIGLTCAAVAFLGYGLAPTWWSFVIFMPIGAFGGLAAPNIQSLMSGNVPPNEQGTLQGANSALSSMANMLAPLVFGTVLSAVTRPEVSRDFSGSAFCVSGVIVLLALVLAFGVRQRTRTVPVSEPGAA